MTFPECFLEFFYDLDIVSSSKGDLLFASYNSGFQVWDITGVLATSPQQLARRDGWTGDFHTFADRPTEFYFKIWDIAAIDPVGTEDTLVVLPGTGEPGLTIWDASTPTDPWQLYQDDGKLGKQVVAANIGNRSYALLCRIQRSQCLRHDPRP